MTDTAKRCSDHLAALARQGVLGRQAAEQTLQAIRSIHGEAEPSGPDDRYSELPEAAMLRARLVLGRIDKATFIAQGTRLFTMSWSGLVWGALLGLLVALLTNLAIVEWVEPQRSLSWPGGVLAAIIGLGSGLLAAWIWHRYFPKRLLGYVADHLIRGID